MGSRCLRPISRDRGVVSPSAYDLWEPAFEAINNGLSRCSAHFLPLIPTDLDMYYNAARSQVASPAYPQARMIYPAPQAYYPTVQQPQYFATFQQPSYGQQLSYIQQSSHVQPPSYSQQASYIQPLGQVQQPVFSTQPSYVQQPP